MIHKHIDMTTAHNSCYHGNDIPMSGDDSLALARCPGRVEKRGSVLLLDVH